MGSRSNSMPGLQDGGAAQHGSEGGVPAAGDGRLLHLGQQGGEVRGHAHAGRIFAVPDRPSYEGCQWTTSALLRKWYGVCGPPEILMTDQGSEFAAETEQLNIKFAVFHDMVFAGARWRMALAERHGAVLKVLLMKLIKEASVNGLDKMKAAVTSACASRNRQGWRRQGSPRSSWCLDESWNMMQALEFGNFEFQVGQPASLDEAYHRAKAIRQVAARANIWRLP